MKCFRLVLTFVALCSLCLALGCGSGEKKKEEQKNAETKDTKTAVAPAAQQPATPAQPPVAQSQTGQTSATQPPVPGAPQEQPAAQPAQQATQPQATTTQPAPDPAPASAPAPAAQPSPAVQPAPEPAAPKTSATTPSEISPRPVTTTAKSKNPPATPFVSSTSKEMGLSFGVDTPVAKVPVKPGAATTATAPLPGALPSAKTPPPAPQATAPAQPAPAPKQEPAKAEQAKTPEKAASAPQPAPQAAPQSGPQSAPGGSVSLASLAKTNKITVVPRSPDKPLHPKAGDASQKFITFCEKWIQTLNKNYIHTERNVELVNKDGKYFASYTAIDMNSIRIEIKESAYDHTPFVGLLRYSETQLEAEGASAQAAKSGKFNVVKRIGVTEIFRYTKDHWVE
jgi:hypothetical protein